MWISKKAICAFFFVYFARMNVTSNTAFAHTSCEASTPMHAYAELFNVSMAVETYFKDIDGLLESAISARMDRQKLSKIIENIAEKNKKTRLRLAAFPLPPALRKARNIPSPFLDFETLFRAYDYGGDDVHSPCFKALISYNNLRIIAEASERLVLEQRLRLYNAAKIPASTDPEKLKTAAENLLRKLRQLSHLTALIK